MEALVQVRVKDIINSAKDASDKHNCNVCGLSNIHKNDLENHINSRGHRKKALKQERDLLAKSDEERFECECCHTTFRGGEFYKAHLGSKTHKRNLRKQNAGKDPLKPVALSAQVTRASRRLRRISIDKIDESHHTDFIRKKYKTRFEKIEDLNYKAYVSSLISYLSLRLALNQNIKNFMISVNDREWKVFGDIVISVFYKEKRTVYAIECKRITQPSKQIDNLEGAKVYLEKQYNYIAQLKEAGKNVNETQFAIFTTCNTTSNFTHSVTLKSTALKKLINFDEDIGVDAVIKVKPLVKKNKTINITGDPENVYSFTLSENENCHMPYLFFYTNQRIFPSMLNQLLKTKFDNYPNISVDYTKYIDNWVGGKLGGNYKLTKTDVVLKIGEILLSPYIVSPKRVNLRHDAFAVWNQVISNVDLTVVKNEPFTISKICQPLNMIIEETLSTNIDAITKSVNLKNEILSNVGEPIKSYFFEVVQEPLRSEVPLHLVYNVFWKAGRIPLLMSTEGQEEVKGFILDVILFMKQMGVNKKFLIKSADLNLSRFKEKLRIFTCLDDVKGFINWDEVKIRVSDTFYLPLGTIQSSDPFFFKWVTPNMFFDISVGRYILRSSSSNKIHNKKNVMKIILRDDVKNELEYQLYPERDLSETDLGSFSETRIRGIEPGIL